MFSFLFSSLLYAQDGTLRGKIIDAETGEPLIGATVVVTGTTRGTISDFDGNYSFTGLEPGTVDITISYISYDPQNFPGVEIKPGQVTVLNANLGQATVALSEVVVAARRQTRTEAALQVMQRKSATVLDGISSQQISRLGDSDAAGALRRVTGISVQDGKYVYIRGLSDRFMKVTLNGAEIPGLDPNFNTVQMDLFPSSLIENMIVLKTYSPDQPSFSGGLVNIETKDFPNKFSISASAKIGFNVNTHFKDQYFGYEKSKTDWWGVDDGLRDIPDKARGMELPLALRKDQVYLSNEVSRAFNKIWSFDNTTAPLNQSYSFSIGNQAFLGDMTLGYIGSFSYSMKSSYYRNGRLDEWEATSASAVSPMETTGVEESDNDVIWSALMGLNLKLNNYNKVGLNYIRNQNGIRTSRYMVGTTVTSDEFDLDKYSLEYLERSLNSYHLSGKSILPSLNKAGIDYMVAFTHAVQNEPDLRFFINEIIPSNGDTIYNIRPNRKPERRFREMYEDDLNLKFDYTQPLQITGTGAKLKFGGSCISKLRNSDENRFTVNTRVQLAGYNGDPSAFLADENIVNYDSVTGTWTGSAYYTNSFFSDQVYSYRGEDIVSSGYIMFDLPVFKRLRIVGGARAEFSETFIKNKVDTFVYTRASQKRQFKQASTEDLDFLPSINMTYTISDLMNIRFAVSRSITRPSFRERAPYAFYEYTEGVTIEGNPNLERGLVNNFDFRWEYFFNPGEMISLSGFYKKIFSPIERYKRQTESELSTYRNGADADLYGVEFELRKNLGFVSFLADFELGTNISIIKSITDVDPLRLDIARSVDPAFSATRPLYGQAPYMVNTYLGYTNSDIGLDGNIAFNVEGPKIVILNRFNTPDTYQRPFPRLNINLSKTLYSNFTLRVSAENLLDPQFNQSFIMPNDDEYSYIRYYMGREFSVSITYQFNK